MTQPSRPGTVSRLNGLCLLNLEAHTDLSVSREQQIPLTKTSLFTRDRFPVDGDG